MILFSFFFLSFFPWLTGWLLDAPKAKALFRRSKAYHTLGKIEEAYEDIAEAKKIDKNDDKAIQSHYKIVLKIHKERIAKLREAQKKLYLGKLTKEDEGQQLQGQGQELGQGGEGDEVKKDKESGEGNDEDTGAVANITNTIPLLGHLTNFVFKLVNSVFKIFRS